MRHITMVLWLLLCFIPCAAQNKQSKPDLSGTWVFDQDRSYPTSKREPVSAILTIVHHDPEIRITTKLTLHGQETVSEVVLYTDGRGEWNAGYTGKLGYSKTEWDERTLVFRHSSTYTAAGWTKHYIEETQRWQLSKDGQNLMRKTVRMEWPNNYTPVAGRTVYRRSP
jgi:hypothetical protein